MWVIIRYCIRFKWKFQFCVGSTSLSFPARYVPQSHFPSLRLRVCAIANAISSYISFSLSVRVSVCVTFNSRSTVHFLLFALFSLSVPLFNILFCWFLRTAFSKQKKNINTHTYTQRHRQSKIKQKNFCHAFENKMWVCVWAAMTMMMTLMMAWNGATDSTHH